MEIAGEFQKNMYFCFIDYVKVFECVDHNKVWKILRWKYQISFPVSWETCMMVKKQQSEQDMKQLIDSKFENEYDRLYIVILLI